MTNKTKIFSRAASSGKVSYTGRQLYLATVDGNLWPSTVHKNMRFRSYIRMRYNMTEGEHGRKSDLGSVNNG